MKEKDNTCNVELGCCIRKIREAKGMTQLELSIDSGLPLSQIGGIECGKVNTTVRSLKQIADSLNVQVKDLFTF